MGRNTARNSANGTALHARASEGESRRQIVDAALARFSTAGYDASSMRDIARDANIRPATIYSHFSSKEEILWYIYQIATETLTAMQAKPISADLVEDEGIGRRLHVFVRTHVRFHAVHSQVARIANSQIDNLSEEHYTIAARWRHDYEDSLRGLLTEASNTGFVDVPDIRIYSYAILQMGIAIATWYRPDGEWGVDQIVEHYDEIAMRLLGTALHDLSRGVA
jgi:AcrR family transcriptional regulator